MSLLSIVQNVAASINTTIPTSIVGNPNADARQWLILANMAGAEVARSHDWASLVVIYSFTATATEAQTGQSPTLGDVRSPPDVEIWNQTTNSKYEGPVSSNEWLRLQSSGVSGAGASGWWRIIGRDLNLFPAPAAGDTIAYESISDTWVTGKLSFTADTDTTEIPEFLIEYNLTWRWLRAHGMDYAEEMATYQRELEKETARDRGLRILVVDRRGGSGYSWPGTIVP